MGNAAWFGPDLQRGSRKKSSFEMFAVSPNMKNLHSWAPHVKVTGKVSTEKNTNNLYQNNRKDNSKASQ